jgi:hypothetical protein
MAKVVRGLEADGAVVALVFSSPPPHAATSVTAQMARIRARTRTARRLPGV